MDINTILCFLNANFLTFLVYIDSQTFESCKKGRCPICGEAMHSACRWRKLRLPEGVPMVVDYDKYFSLCCSKDGCRKRFNPPSVRFAGRSSNLLLLLALAGFLKKGTSEKKLLVLSKEFGVTERTLCRWKLWWQKVYSTSKYWCKLRLIWSLGGSGINVLFQKAVLEKPVTKNLLVDFIKIISPIFFEVSLSVSQ